MAVVWCGDGCGVVWCGVAWCGVVVWWWLSQGSDDHTTQVGTSNWCSGSISFQIFETAPCTHVQ
eukprot:11694008-Prorocentrum_lima.AAC.1